MEVEHRLLPSPGVNLADRETLRSSQRKEQDELKAYVTQKREAEKWCEENGGHVWKNETSIDNWIYAETWSRCAGCGIVKQNYERQREQKEMEKVLDH